MIMVISNIKIGYWLWSTTSNADQFDVIMIKHQTLSNLMIIVVLINIEHTYIADQFSSRLWSVINIIQIDNNEDGDDEPYL